MERISRLRAAILLGLFSLILVFFGVKLFSLQIIETGGDTNNITTYTSRTIVKASRGDLLDRNGNVLVGNRASYNLVFNHYVIKGHPDRNQALYNLVKKCEELGITYTEHFPLSETRPFEYTLEEYSSAWQGYFQSYLTDRELDSDMTAPLLMEQLREKYKIPAEWTMDEARAVIGLLYEFDLRGVAGLANYVFLEDVSDENLSELLELNVPGLMVESSTVREYYTKYAAHILGYVGAMNPDQWAYYEPLGGYNMDAVVGQSGFELAFEEYLHGVDGVRIDKVSTDGTIISQEYRQEPQAGSNVETTIDINIQMVAEDALAELIAKLIADGGDGSDIEGAAVVVMEVKSGEVLACASYPTYDPATFREMYNEIKAQDFDPFFNRALQGIYPPGSTYKMSTLVAAMESGHLAFGEKIHTKGKFTRYEAQGFAPACLLWNNKKQTHGTIDGSYALKVSCNYFFFELADRMTIEDMDKTAAALGLGEPTGVELYEDTGYRANPETKKELYDGSDEFFSAGDKIIAAIGQSENRFTPMQLAVYASTLANQGVRYRATFLNRVVSSDYSELEVENTPEILSTLEISDETYKTLVDGMVAVAHESGGTGYKYLKDANVTVAAKTGTAEHGLGKQYSDHGAFVCFAPADDPEIAIALYGEKAGHGSTLAQVARIILDAYFTDEEESAVISTENKLS